MEELKVTIRWRAENTVMESLWRWSQAAPDRVAVIRLDGSTGLAGHTDTTPGEAACHRSTVGAWDPPENNLGRVNGDADWTDENIDIAVEHLTTEWLTAVEDHAAALARNEAAADIDDDDDEDECTLPCCVTTPHRGPSA